MARVYALEEVQKHSNAASCWVIVKNKVYDLTDFLGDHPGGAEAILKYAGNVCPPTQLHFFPRYLLHV